MTTYLTGNRLVVNIIAMFILNLIRTPKLTLVTSPINTYSTNIKINNNELVEW